MKKSETQELKKIAQALAKQEAAVKGMQKAIAKLEREIKSGKTRAGKKD